MSAKLDQALDEIVKTRRQTTRRPVRTGRRAASTPVVAGIVKNVKNVRNIKSVKGSGKAALVPITASGESKIIVQGLPSDVNEQQIKDYFAKTIGPVKKVFLTYGPNGLSRGISTIVFSRSGSAVDAATQLNGVKVDNRAMKIEVVVGADLAPISIPAKALGDRIAGKQGKSTNKNAPKSAAAAPKGKNDNTRNTKRGRNNGRAKPKTADELDAEMTDYFGAPANGAVAQPAQVPAAGDASMEDEIM